MKKKQILKIPKTEFQFIDNRNLNLALFARKWGSFILVFLMLSLSVAFKRD